MNNKYYISFVTSTLNSGGSERVISLLANALQERGHTVEIININRHEVFYPINAEVKLTFVEEECGGTFIGKKMRWLRSYIKKNRPDVVIPFMTDVECVTLASLMGVRVPVISSERYDPRASNLQYKTIRWLFLRLTTHLVVQTEDIKSCYSKALQKRTSVIYNPVRNDIFPSSFLLNSVDFCHDSANLTQASSVLAASKVPPSSLKRIISVGRLAPQKNFPMLINAFAAIKDEFPDWQLLILGEGPDRESLQLTVDHLQLTDRVLMPGRSEHVIDELRKSKLFCMSTNAEGMSNALIEAMCVGLPVVSTDVCGAKELLCEPESGIIVPVGDAEALAKALRKVMSDESLMQQMAERNLAKAEWFKQEKIVDQWEKLIETVVSQSYKSH